jgi:hypothetical protein
MHSALLQFSPTRRWRVVLALLLIRLFTPMHRL